MKYIQIISPGKPLGAVLFEGFQSLQNLFRKPVIDVLAKSTVYVNERKMNSRLEMVKKKAPIVVLIPDEYLVRPAYELTADHVAYEDQDIVVIDKPPGLPTQATQIPGQDHLYGAVISYYTTKHPQKLSYVGLHHRLDRDTSGLIVFTRKPSMNKSISEQFKNHQIKKLYHAIVTGPKPEKERWTVEAPITRLHHIKNKFKFGIDLKRGEKAVTRFRFVRTLEPDRHLLECQPITGRTHQIRIHLAHSKLPILGDTLYGKPWTGRMMLHASQLELLHPRTNQPLQIKSQRSLEI